MNINWQRVMLDLRSAGCSGALVGRKARMDPATAQRLARGDKREPSFSQGMALLDLHLAHCPDKHRLAEIT